MNKMKDNESVDEFRKGWYGGKGPEIEFEETVVMISNTGKRFVM